MKPFKREYIFSNLEHKTMKIILPCAGVQNIYNCVFLLDQPTQYKTI